MKKTFWVAMAAVTMANAGNIDDIRRSMQLNYLENIRNIETIHRENVDIVRQNAVYYTNIVKNARKYYHSFIAKEWGDSNVKLSTRKRFTQYSDDMKSRENIDFEKGKVTIEILTDPDAKPDPALFDKKLRALEKENAAEALHKDPVAKLSTDYMEKKKIAAETQTHSLNKEPVVAGLIETKKIKPGQIKEKVVTLKDGKRKKIFSVEVPMVPDHLKKRALRYKKPVLEHAKKYGIEPAYVFGTIQTESYFNPLAVSYIPAYGLMQIVPTTAGVDAYAALYGKKKVVPPPYLYDPKNNIKLGTKYIQLIKDRYLRGVKNPESLKYCTAVAYNAGIGSLFRAFTGSKRKRKEAIGKINSMTPDEVYHLLRTSPRLNKEARNYVKKIKEHSALYVQWNGE